MAIYQQRKRNITEEYCEICLETIIHLALGRPKPRTTHHGQQGVVICDGVGTNLGYDVVTKALDLGLEILVRVPRAA